MRKIGLETGPVRNVGMGTCRFGKKNCDEGCIGKRTCEEH